MNTYLHRAAVLAALFSIPPLAHSEYGIEIGHSSEFNDNADLSEDQQADEREDRTWLELGLQFERDNWNLVSQYQLTNVHFDSDSETPQQDTEEIVGNTRFSAAAFKQRAELTVNHNRQSLLGAPGGLELQSNFVERDSLTFSPKWYFQRNSRQQVFVEGYFNRVDYEDRETSNNSVNSNTQGLILGANRRISEVTTLGLQAQQLTTEYDGNNPDNDYASYVATYSTTLRRLTYSLTAGVNRSQSGDNPTLTSPRLGLDAAYTTGATTVSYSAQFFITDTSRGNTSSTDATSGQGANLGNGDTSTISRYELFSNRLNVRHQFNERLTFRFTLDASNQDHEEDPTQDRSEFGLSSTVNYRLPSRWSWRLSAGYQNLEFGSASLQSDYTLNTYSLSGNYAWNDRLDTRLTVIHRQRDSDLATSDYTQNAITAQITYRLRP